MTDRTTEQLVPGRECGACNACCVAMTIDQPDIQKMPGSACRHSLGGGCGIHEIRPNVCRVFFCGWRRSTSFPDDWRPDLSGVIADLQINSLPQFGPLAVNLILIGNPLKTVRRPDFIDFVAGNVRGMALYLMLPGPKGTKFTRQALNSPFVMEASMRGRSELRQALELLLKRMTQYRVEPYVMENGGADVGT